MKILGLLTILGCCAAHAAAPIIQQDFETSESGWIAFGGGGTVRLTREPANVKAGKSALAFEYTAAAKGFSAAVLPLADVSLANMKALRFWLKTDSAVGIAVLMNEKTPGGGNFSALVWSPKDTWQRIELTPADFILSEGPNDPKDSKGKLDLDRIQGIGLVDVSQMFSAMPRNPNLPIAIDPHTGKHVFYVDDFEVVDTAPPSAAAAATDSVIDDFHRSHVDWLTLGGAELSVDASGKPVAGRALKVEYQQTEGHYIVLTHALGPMDLRTKNKLAFDIASDKEAQLIISLEERNPGKGQGPRYQVDVQVPGGGKMDRREVALSAFQPDGNGTKDPNGKLDLDQLKSISILDVTGALNPETARNTLWIGNIQAVSR